ncbi:hypothetical protein RhiirC2_799252 [Rhizophagus irregularis]|uniref:Uncharacterized protein n=1 Tax=Rhizophagus irregularis TaxID=588596 RepID=A0A2N1M5A0_9GLOM|nr:hypothetical protein RhiirC2_799252 [Rhizophagus irregularis]
MTSNTNINSDKSEAQLYELLLYKKKDIIAIQEKLGMVMVPLGPPSINGNTNQTALNQNKKGKTLEDSFRLLFDLVEELRLIQEEVKIGRNPILIILYRCREELMDMSSGELSLGETYHLLLYLEDDINLVQDHLSIVGYTNPKISRLEADKNARAYLQKFRRCHHVCHPWITNTFSFLFMLGLILHFFHLIFSIAFIMSSFIHNT